MISGARAYARSRLNAMGLKEWTDGFNWKNIPKSRLDEYYIIELGTVFGVQNNQDNQDMDVEFTIHLFKSPTRDPRALIDSAVSLGDTVIADFLAAGNRTTQAEIKNVRFNTLTIDPLDNSNDNGLEIKIAFMAHVIISTR